MLHNNITAREKAYRADLDRRTRDEEPDLWAWMRDARAYSKRRLTYEKDRCEMSNAERNYSAVAGFHRERRLIKEACRG